MGQPFCYIPFPRFKWRQERSLSKYLVRAQLLFSQFT